MSAKGRGRHAGGDVDYYPTPAWAVERFLDDCGAEFFGFGDVAALEPTCGDGAIVRACDAWLLATGHELPEWTGVELRTGALDSRTRLAHHVEGVDFRAWEAVAGGYRRRFSVAIGNPPFALAESVVRHALNMADRVAMLLRVSFLESEERVPFWQGVGADPALRVLPQRPSFDGEGTDSCAYAWFVWGSSMIRGVGVLDSTPLEVRNAQKPDGLHVDPRQASLFDALEGA